MKKESGQVVILIMLVMLIGLTIGLSLVSRSLQDLRQTSVSDFRNRAFTVSESAVEESLRQGLGNLASAGGCATVGGTWNGTTCTSANSTLNGVNYNYAVSAGASGAYVTKTNVAKDDVVQVDLMGSTGNLRICWDNTASIIVSIVYNSGGYQIEKWAYNPSFGGPAGNGFATATTSTCSIGSFTGAGTISQQEITLPSGSLLARIRPLYNSAKIGVSATNLPSQSYRAVGTATLGNVTAKTEVTQSKPYLPAIFDYVIFSNTGSITK